MCECLWFKKTFYSRHRQDLDRGKKNNLKIEAKKSLDDLINCHKRHRYKLLRFRLNFISLFNPGERRERKKKPQKNECQQITSAKTRKKPHNAHLPTIFRPAVFRIAQHVTVPQSDSMKILVSTDRKFTTSPRCLRRHFFPHLFFANDQLN